MSMMGNDGLGQDVDRILEVGIDNENENAVTRYGVFEPMQLISCD
jgi:hypothetical protein